MVRSMLTEQTFRTGSRHLNFAEGANNGAPLVLLHGAAARWQRLQKLIDRLEPHWQLYAVDLRGHGKSDRADRYHLTDYASDLTSFLRDMVREPAVLLGHSLGAMTAIALAAAAPESVRAIVLLDPPLDLHNTRMADTRGAAWFKSIRNLIAQAKSYDVMLDAVRKTAPQATEAEIQFATANIANTDPKTMDALLQNELLQDFDLANALRHITCPALLLCGEWNAGSAVRDEDVEFFRANIPDGIAIRFPSTSHNVPDERTEEVVREMEKFLE